MKKTLLCVLAFVALWERRLGFAQTEAKPVLCVSFAGYDKLMANIGAVGQLSGNPDMGKQMEMMLTMMTQGKGLAGLDRQPWGAAVMTNGSGPFAIFGFLPVNRPEATHRGYQGRQSAIGRGRQAQWRRVRDPTGRAAPLCQAERQLGNGDQQDGRLAQGPRRSAEPLGDLPKNYDWQSGSW